MKKRKPKVWEWILVGVLILMYLFREELHSISGYLPPFLAFVLERIAKTPGVGQTAEIPTNVMWPSAERRPGSA